MPQARDSRYWLEKARQCFSLAATIADKKMAESLRELGYEFVDEATALGFDPAMLPQSWRRPLSD
jgi:hypothetical protein